MEESIESRSASVRFWVGRFAAFGDGDVARASGFFLVVVWMER